MAISNDFRHYRTLYFVLIVIIFCSTNSASQNLTSSNLPIVIITTDINPDTDSLTEILDDPKVNATMQIIAHSVVGERNRMTDVNTPEFLNYNGRIKIELRGSSSQFAEKKPYGLTLYESNDTSKQSVEILGMPKENDWILNAINFDPALMRDMLFYTTARKMGNYASRGKYCEVVVNGDYKGLYILQEKLKVDENRINIATLKKSENTMPDISGGYIIKADKPTGGDPVAWTMDSNSWDPEYFHEYPSYKDITPQQHGYIYNEFTKLADVTYVYNSSLKDGFPTLIDIPSFVDYMLLNELASNPDAYQFSTFFHKDKGGKLRAGPIWDMNISLGHDLFFWGLDRSKYNVWQFKDGGNDGSKFWTDLFNTPAFRCVMAKRWKELTVQKEPLSVPAFNTLIDSIQSLITEASFREEKRWESVGNLTQNVLTMKQFVRDRVYWISQNIGSLNGCLVPEIPPLIISKINYHPSELADTVSSNDKEFIEITNIGIDKVTLSGYYLRELGVSYQFPYNSSINAGESIYLAGDPIAFKKEYGKSAFGQFERNLPNDSFRLVLADAFGNTIDKVEYKDRDEWPSAADGLGSFLALKNLELDNNLATSWEATTEFKLPEVPVIKPKPTHFALWPNPAQSALNIQSVNAIQSVEIFNYLGAKMMIFNTNSQELILDISPLPAGMYIIKVTDSIETYTHKLVKR